MQIQPYLSFNGRCEEAFAFYARCFGGHMGQLNCEGSDGADHP